MLARAARPGTSHQIHHSSLSIADMMQHGAGRHQIEVSRLDPPRQDVFLTKLEPGYIRVDQGQVQIHRHHPPGGRDPPSQPGRHRSVTTANFERMRPRPDAQPLNVAAVHRIEQPRHQCEPLALAFLVMIKDVFWHASPARLWPATCRGQTPRPLAKAACARH